MGRLSDSFILSVPGAGSIDASIDVPGDFPLTLEPGAAYIIGFTYITGSTPPADSFDVDWTATLGNGQTSTARPSVVIEPNSPEGSGAGVRNGTIRGVLPLVRDITYEARIWIRQG